MGVKTTRLAKRVDSECWECILRVARWIEEAERRAIEGMTVSEVSRDTLIYGRKQIINHFYSNKSLARETRTYMIARNFSI